MLTEISKLQAEAEAFEPTNKEEFEAFRIAYLGKKGHINSLFEAFKALPGAEKKDIGKPLNALKQYCEQKVAAYAETFETFVISLPSDFDVTLPTYPTSLGSRHPLSIVKNQIIQQFQQLGFTLSDGPELVDDFHNFEALNFEADHPARDMQDTFFVDLQPELLLRTHTSSVQVQEMQRQAPPIRTISPGRVYRNETISARAHCQFHQVEGLYIAENVSFADLRQTLFRFVQQFFGPAVKIRFRPSYFPFTEPSAEMDIDCQICHGDGCNVCKHTGWVEILGCGMVDPKVLTNCGIDAVKYNGFAFGMGVERLTMLKYQIKDLRLFFENDLRFIQQFKGEMA